MTLRHLLPLSVVAVLLACGPQAIPAQDSTGSGTTGGEIGLSPNGEDSGASPPIADAGDSDKPPDAGSAIDAGPTCPAFTQSTSDGCVPEATIHLTGTAFATKGNALIAGTGQQPVFLATVIAPAAETISKLAFVVSFDGGPVSSQTVISSITDDAGIHFKLPFDTTSLTEQTYAVVATAPIGSDTVTSNAIALIVDRTPPHLSVDLSNDGGVVARDAKLGAQVTADDGDGSGATQVSVTVAGPQVFPGYTAGSTLPQWIFPDVVFTPPLAIDGNTAVATGTLDLSQVPYDAWSTDQDGFPFFLEAIATDLAGNVATWSGTVDATRQLWQRDDAYGLASLGAQGQVLVNDGSDLYVITKEGQALQDIPLGLTGGFNAAGMAPSTLAHYGQLGTSYLIANSASGQQAGSELVSVDAFGNVVTEQIANQLAGLALDPANLQVHAVDQFCNAYASDPALSWVNDVHGPSVGIGCASAVPMLFGGTLYEATPLGVLSYTASSLAWIKTFPNAAPVIPAGTSTYGGLSDIAPALLGATFFLTPALAMVSDSLGDLLTLDGTYQLRFFSIASYWTRQLSSGLYGGVGGVVAGAGGLIYALDGNGSLSAYDSLGTLHWQSPDSLGLYPPLIDHCTSHAVLSGLHPTGVVVDSPGPDASPISWPMAGHDVLQSFNAASTDDVDCANHL